MLFLNQKYLFKVKKIEKINVTTSQNCVKQDRNGKSQSVCPLAVNEVVDCLDHFKKSKSKTRVKLLKLENKM